MGACATKPKADGALAPAPEPEKKDVDAAVAVLDAVDPQKTVEVKAVEVSGEGDQSDKGKEVVDVDDDKVDDQSVKRRSLSNLFKEVLFIFRIILRFGFYFFGDFRFLISFELKSNVCLLSVN